MKALTSDTTGASKRTPVRLSYKDKELLDNTLGKTVFSTRSDVIRAALSFLNDVWKLKGEGKRIVVRNDNKRLQYELFLTGISAEDLRSRGDFLKAVVDADRKGRMALVPDEPQELIETARKGRAKQGIIFEIRTSAQDLQLLSEVVESGVAPTPSQAIRMSLEVYSHAVNRCLGGYRIAAQSPSGELENVTVPGINIGDAEAIVFLVNDREAEREEIEKIIRGRGEVAPVSYVYEENLGLESNLVRALNKARTLANSGVRHFLIDLCWVISHPAMAAEFVDPIEWGIVPSKENPTEESIATFAGFKFIEAVVWEPWARDLTINYSTARWYDLVEQQELCGLSYTAREKLFEENVHDRAVSRKITITPFVNPPDAVIRARELAPTSSEVDRYIQELEELEKQVGVSGERPKQRSEAKRAVENQVAKVAAIVTAEQAATKRLEMPQ